MPIRLSQEAEDSLFEILKYYERKSGIQLADSIEERILQQISDIEGFEMSVPESDVYPGTRKLVISRLPYVAYIRTARKGKWEVMDIIHTSRKIPKNK
jgi:plasmid stabilization system protein ParE